VIVLEKKLAEWPQERVDACTDLETLRGVIALAKRVDRHEQLMIRHLSKGMAVGLKARKRNSPLFGPDGSSVSPVHPPDNESNNQ